MGKREFNDAKKRANERYIAEKTDRMDLTASAAG